MQLLDYVIQLAKVGDFVVYANASCVFGVIWVEPASCDTCVYTALNVACKTVADNDCLGRIEIVDMVKCVIEKFLLRLAVTDLLANKSYWKILAHTATLHACYLHRQKAVGHQNQCVTVVDKLLQNLFGVVDYGKTVM